MAALTQTSLLLFLTLVGGCCGYYKNPDKVKGYRFDYEWSDAGGWMKYHAVPVSWDKARMRCHAEGSVLASPLTHQLKAAIVSFVQKQKGSNHEQGITIFSGVHSIFSEGDYSSVEGVPLPRLAVSWEAGEPDNYEGSERCLMMETASNGSMADTRCDRLLPYVCYKKDPDHGLIISECGTTDPEYVLEHGTGSCYKFHRRRLPWSEAYMTCAAEGGHLAIINDEREADVTKMILARHLKSTAAVSVFVGFHDWGHLGTSFSTIQGETLEANYHAWADGTRKKTKTDLGEYCGSVTKDVKLMKNNCNSPLAFLCEMTPLSLY